MRTRVGLFAALLVATFLTFAPRDASAQAIAGKIAIIAVTGIAVGTVTETVSVGSTLYFLAVGERQTTGWAIYNTVTGAGTLAVGLVGFMPPFQSEMGAAPGLGIPLMIAGAAQAGIALHSLLSPAPPPDETSVHLVPSSNGLALVGRF